VIPDINAATPSGVALFSFRTGGITVSEMVVVATLAGTAFRLYSESGGDFGHRGIGSIQTGFAVASTSPNPATINLELTRLDGSSTGLMGTLAVPANGQTAVFLNQVQGFGSLQTPFQGVLRVSSTTPISITGLRARYNERGDFLMTMTPPVNEMTTPSTADVYFPQIVDSGGYTTQLVLISGQAGQTSSGTIQFVSQTGGALNITVR